MAQLPDLPEVDWDKTWTEEEKRAYLSKLEGMEHPLLSGEVAVCGERLRSGASSAA